MPEAPACGPLDVGHVFESAGRTITESDIVGFACLSGDFNRLHVDHEYAKGTPTGSASPTVCWCCRCCPA